MKNIMKENPTFWVYFAVVLVIIIKEFRLYIQ